MKQCRVRIAQSTVGARWTRWAIGAMLLLTAVTIGGIARQPEGARVAPADDDVRFAAVHVIVDAGEAALGAYQVDLRAIEGDVKIVGIEGATGEGAERGTAFANAPYYDPKAMMGERVVIGAFSLDEALPSGRVRVATVHVRIAGDVPPVFEASVMAAADGNGKRIEAAVATSLSTEADHETDAGAGGAGRGCDRGANAGGGVQSSGRLGGIHGLSPLERVSGSESHGPVGAFSCR